MIAAPDSRSSTTNPLMPVDHAEQQVHIEITLNGTGKFRAASVVAKETTFIPATEESAGRTSGPSRMDWQTNWNISRLREVGLLNSPRIRRAENSGNAARKAKKEKNEKDLPAYLYLDQLRRWVASEPDPHVEAVLRYVEGWDHPGRPIAAESPSCGCRRKSFDAMARDG